MKTVFSNRETAHVWAQLNQPEGRSSHGNVYFTGRALYSYGSHYLTGFIMPDGRALINGRNYSISTAKHRGAAYSAARHRNPLTIPDLTQWGDILRYIAAAADRGERIPPAHRRRLRSQVESEALALSDEAGEYLLTVAGYPAASWQRIKAAAERKRDKAAERGRRALVRQAREFAREYAAESPREFAQRLTLAKARLTDFNRRALTDLRDTLQTAHRDGTRGNTKADARRRAILWQRLKLVREIIANADKFVRQNETRRDDREAIGLIRAAVNPAYQPGTLYSASRWDRLLAACRRIAPLAPAATREKLNELAAMAAVARDELQKRAAAEKFAEQAERRAAWLRGDGQSYSGLTDERGGAVIRATGVQRDESGAIIGGTLQTSQGASAPLPHAIRAFRFLKLCHDKGRAWEANGRTIRVGHYRIDRVEPSGDFVAGCHRINWGETERLARELGVFDAPADESALEPSTAAA